MGVFEAMMKENNLISFGCVLDVYECAFNANISQVSVSIQ